MIIGIYCLLLLNLYAQNLVIDPSFEDYVGYPAYRQNNITMRSSQKILNHWSFPFNVTPDFILYTGLNLQPKDGKGYIGLITMNNFDPNYKYNYKEYIEGSLKETLKPGKEYCVSMYVSLAEDALYATDGIGVYFSESYIDSVNFGYLPYQPQVQSIEGEVIKSEKWIEISGCFVAKGGEQYIIIGNFKPNKLTKWEKRKNVSFPSPYPYYYIDNVSVTEIKEGMSCHCEKREDLNSVDIDIENFNFAENQTVILNNVFFDTDQSSLMPESYKELNRLVRAMKKNSSLEIELRGHTDNTGSEDRNQLLSERRALAVMNYLLRKGISAYRMTYKGYGSELPLSDNTTAVGKQKNRRVDFFIRKK